MDCGPRLAELYFKGLGVFRDLDKAKSFIDKTLEKAPDDPYGNYCLAIINHAIKNDRKRLFKELTNAEKLGSKKAKSMLGHDNNLASLDKEIRDMSADRRENFAVFNYGYDVLNVKVNPSTNYVKNNHLLGKLIYPFVGEVGKVILGSLTLLFCTRQYEEAKKLNQKYLEIKRNLPKFSFDNLKTLCNSPDYVQPITVPNPACHYRRLDIIIEMMGVKGVEEEKKYFSLLFHKDMHSWLNTLFDEYLSSLKTIELSEKMKKKTEEERNAAEFAESLRQEFSSSNYDGDGDYDPFYEESDSYSPYVELEDGTSVNSFTGNDQDGNHWTRDPFSDEWTMDD